MMSRFLLLLCLAAIAAVADAGEIDGIVRDAGGLPVEGVTVHAAGVEATTDAHGHFHLADVPPGAHDVTVAGEPDTARQVRVPEAGIASVTLRLPTRVIGTITVRATPMPGRSPLEVARPVTVLAGDELTRKVASSIGETVANEPGISATSFGAGASRPVIRGLGDDRVRMMTDGIGTLDVSSVSDDHGVTIEPILVDQIEILRGPATLLYGTGAIGGAVNVIDGRIPERLPAHDVEGRAEVRAASATGERSGVARLDGRAGERWAWHVDAYRRTADDYGIPGEAELHHDEEHDEEDSAGRLENSALHSGGGTAGVSWVGGRGYVGASVAVTDNGYGVPFEHAHEDEGHEEEEVHVTIAQRQTRFDVAGAFTDPFTGFERLRFRVGINDYEHRELEGPEVGTVFANDAWEGRMELTHAVLAGWRGAFGVQLHERDFAAIGDEAFTPPVETVEQGAFWVGERTVGSARVELGVRGERVRHRPTGAPGRSFPLRNASVAVAVPFAGIDAYVNAGRNERAPVAEELYSFGAHLATGTFEVGDPALVRERADALEFALRDTSGRVRWSLNAYRTRFDGFIHLSATGDDDAESGLPILEYRQQDATFRGFEAEADATLVERDWGSVDVRVFADAVRATLGDGSPVPRIPPRRNGLSLRLDRVRWAARIGWTRVAGQDRTAAGETPTAGHDLLDAEFERRGGRGRSDWLWFVRGSNLLDETVRRHTSFLKDVAPLPGRSVQVGVRVEF